jgi:predicted nucleic acid-binding protein
MKIVFDTYAWIEYFEGSKKGEVVEGFLQENEILTPSIVLLELSYKADKKGWDIKKYLNYINMKSKIIGINDDFILEFGGVYNSARLKAKDIGIVDVIVLANAKMNGAKILTGDPHFSGFEETIILK